MLKHLKKFLALFAVTAMAFSFVACTANSDKDKDDDKKVEADDKDDKDDKEDKEDKEDKNDKDVTAESVLGDISIEDIESFTMDMEFVMDMEIDMEAALYAQGLTEEEVLEAIEESGLSEEELLMAILIDMSYSLKYGENYGHASADMEMDALGMTESVTMESYADYSDDEKTISYTYDEYSETWIVEEETTEDSDENPVDLLNAIFDYVDDAEITSEDDDTYTLTVVIDGEKLYEDESESMDELVDGEGMFEDVEDVWSEIGDLEIVIVVEKETGYVTSVDIDLTDVLSDYMISMMADDEMDISEAVSVNEFYLALDFSDYNDTEVEIPQDIIDEAVRDESVEEDEEDDEEDDDKETVTPADGTWDIYTWDDEYVGTVTIPEGYTVDETYSDENGLYLEDGDWNSFDVDTYVPSWVEGIMEGEEFVPNLKDYTRQEVEERDSIETNQGTVRVFVEIWSMDEEPDINYFETIVYLLDCGDNYLAVEGYIDEIEDSGYTVESLIQTLLQ